jgi:hypothetical protein
MASAFRYCIGVLWVRSILLREESVPGIFRAEHALSQAAASPVTRQRNDPPLTWE